MKKLFFLLPILMCHALVSSPIPKIERLSLDEKIGQLIMMATLSSAERNREFIKNSPYVLDQAWTTKMIKEHHVGGVIFLGAGSPHEQAIETERLQAISKYPLLVGLDAEWGLAMRHQENVVHFPHAMTLGALAPEDDYLIYEVGQEIGRQCKMLGVHINFAPVVDVNNNPRNPIINTRSFGECPQKVAHKAALFIKGMQSAQILACAKHFPGHGDTEIDSHYARGVITHSQERLQTVELVPFKQAIDEGVDAIMTAHLDVPALSKDEAVPATLSHRIITDLLRRQFSFEGLVITDGLGMKGVTDAFKPGELELKALKAGNDVLLCPVDVPHAIARIKHAIEQGELSEKELDEHVERILCAKRKVITQTAPPFDGASILTSYAQDLKRRLYQAAVTVVRSKEGTFPLAVDKKIVLKTFGRGDEFVKALKKHRNVEHIPSELTESHAELASDGFDDNDQVIVSLHLEGRSGMIEMQAGEGMAQPPAYISFIKKHAKKITLALFGNPYNLNLFSEVPTVVVGYENEPEAQQAVAETMRGLHAARGILPVRRSI